MTETNGESRGMSRRELFAALPAAFLLDPGSAALRRVAGALLAHQASDGALAMDPLPDAATSLLPYCANYAAMGLASAAKALGRTDLTRAGRHWIRWYAGHQGAGGGMTDYAGPPPNWHSRGTFDSVDSYSATFIWAAASLWPDTRKFPPELYLAVQRAASAIFGVLQPNGLTIAKPGWPVMYTMDAVETMRGLAAAAAIARSLGHAEDEGRWRAAALRIDKALDTVLWNDAEGCCFVGLPVRGPAFGGLKQWYPDVMANLLAIAWRTPSNRNKRLFRTLAERFGSRMPGRVEKMDDLNRICWWGLAAAAAGDSGMKARAVSAAETFDPVLVRANDVETLGLAALLLAGADPHDLRRKIL